MKTKNHVKSKKSIRGVGKLGYTESGKVSGTIRKMQAAAFQEKDAENPVETFAKACDGKTRDEIYDLFEGLNPKLRQRIYDGFALSTSPEPFRSAARTLGHLFNIKSLKKY